MDSSSPSPNHNPNYQQHQPYRSRFGDTTMTKVFVGGLAWETPTEELRQYFEQFGDILEAVIITDKNSGRSKGYGFVTFREAESARRSVAEANPMIGGRRANCNIASMGRPQPSTPPRAGYNVYAPGSASRQPTAPPTFSTRLPVQVHPPPTPLIYTTPYGYMAYGHPYQYGYQQQNVPGSQAAAAAPPNYYLQHHMYGAGPPAATSAQLAAAGHSRPPYHHSYYPPHLLAGAAASNPGGGFAMQSTAVPRSTFPQLHPGGVVPSVLYRSSPPPFTAGQYYQSAAAPPAAPMDNLPPPLSPSQKHVVDQLGQPSSITLQQPPKPTADPHHEVVAHDQQLSSRKAAGEGAGSDDQIASTAADTP